jgi:hypothetical protein
MHRRLVTLVLLFAFFLPAVLSAQDSRLNGLWVAPIAKGTGPKFLAFTFQVTGDTFTGTVSDTGGTPDRFVNGKIANGQISFSIPKQKMEGAAIEIFYTGTLKNEKRLDLVEAIHFTGYTVVRKPGTQAQSTTLEGEWVLQGLKDTTYVLHVQGETLTGEVVDRLHLMHNGKDLINQVVHLPLTEGTVHSKDFSFSFINHWFNPIRWSGTVDGDHLNVNTETTIPLRAVRLADAVVR